MPAQLQPSLFRCNHIVDPGSSIAATFGRGRSSLTIASPTSSRACSPESALRIARISAATIPLLASRTCPSASRRKWTVQPLPGAAEHLTDRVLQPFVRIGGDKLDAGQAAADEAAQEVAPERLRLALIAVEPDHLAPKALVDAMRDHQALAHDGAAVSDLLDPRRAPAALELRAAASLRSRPSGQLCVRFKEEQPATPQKLGQRCSSKRPQSPCQSLVRDCPQLLGHSEASLPQATFWRDDLDVEGVREVGPREWNGYR